MVRIRLMRVGKRKQPSYRVVVADSRSPRDGRIIEAIGHYQPRQEPSVVEIDSDRAVHWLQRGAQPSDTVRKLLQISGAWYTFTGERPPAGSAPPVAPRPTPAESAVAPAGSVEAAQATATKDERDQVAAEASEISSVPDDDEGSA
jgi:small subunit ribosomal protein S16